MKKKLLAVLMAFAMVLGTIAYVPAYAASTTNNSYGKYAYSVLQYLD